MQPRVAISRVYDQNTYAALEEAVDRFGDRPTLIQPGSRIAN